MAKTLDTGQPGSASSFRTVETVETATDSEELLLVVMTETGES